MLRIFWKSLTALFLALVTTLVATGVYGYRYRDQIIQKFLEEANKRLKTAIQVSSIQLTSIENFPNIGVALQDVVIKDITNPTREFIIAHKIYCYLNLWKLIHRQYQLSRLCLTQGRLYLGKELTQRREVGEQAAVWQKSVAAMVPDQLELKDIEITYKDGQYYCRVDATQIHANLRWAKSGLEVEIQGQANIKDIPAKEILEGQNLPITLRATLCYQKQNQIWFLDNAQLKHGSSSVAARGSWGEASPVSLRVQGKAISPRFLAHFLPELYYQSVHFNDLQGQLTLDLNIHKQMGKTLALQGNFELQDGALVLSPLPDPIALDILSGHIDIPDIQDLKKAMLSVDKMTCTLAESALKFHFTLSNFHDLHLQCAAEGTIDLASIGSALAHFAIRNALGKLNVSWKLATHWGTIGLGIQKKDDFCVDGTLQAQGIQFQLGESQVPCKEIVASLVFQNDEIVLENCSGSMGPGSFSMNGNVRNFLPYLLSYDQKPHAAIKLYMDHLDLDALFPTKHQVVDSIGITSSLSMASQWALDLDCDIQQMHFRRFLGKNVRAKLAIKDQKLRAEKLQLNVAGGKVFADGVLDATTDHISLHTKSILRNVQLATLFYMFENFQQQFLTDRHLGGEVFADVDLTTQADKLGNVYWDTFRADIDARISNGVLYQFEPIQPLAKYMAQGSLDQLYFSELKNRIQIKNRTIYLPLMEIYSNLTCIQLSGTHTFDGKIDYNFVVPFASSQNQKGVVPEDTLAGINLFFRLQGDVDNYVIKYDTEALRNSLKGELKEQGKVLEDIFYGKYREKIYPQELAPNDYFEFD